MHGKNPQELNLEDFLLPKEDELNEFDLFDEKEELSALHGSEDESL